MNAITRRKFLKRTGGATVASVLAWNLATQPILAAPTGAGGSSYKLQGTWAGAGGHPEPEYSEHVFTSVISRLGPTYEGKIKMWTTPHIGEDKTKLKNKFSLEINQVGLGHPNGAPPVTSGQRTYLVLLPDPYVPDLDVLPYSTGILAASTNEYGGSVTYLASSFPTWLTSTFPPPSGTYKAIYTSRIHVSVAPTETETPILFEVDMPLTLSAQELVVYQDSSYTDIYNSGWVDYSADVVGWQLNVLVVDDP